MFLFFFESLLSKLRLLARSFLDFPESVSSFFSFLKCFWEKGKKNKGGTRGGKGEKEENER